MDSGRIMKQTDLHGEHMETDFSRKSQLEFLKTDHAIANMDIFYGVAEDIVKRYWFSRN